MSGIDDWIAGWSDSTSLLIIMALAGLLGLRHATDPDHLAAVSALVATGDEQSARSARRLGLVWGLGHATTLVLLGVPIILFSAYLPEAVQRGTETAIGVMIVALAVWLLVRWRRGVRPQGHPRARPCRRPMVMDTNMDGGHHSVPTRSASYTERAARPASACCCWRGSRIEPLQSPRSWCSHSAPRHRCRSCRPDGERHSATVPRGGRCTA